MTARTMLYAAAFAAATFAAPAMAQDGAQDAPPPPSQEEVDNATATVSLIMQALQAEEVDQATKEGLFMCLYFNPLKEVSEKATSLMETVPAEVERNASLRLTAIARVCGAPLPQPEGAAAPQNEGR